MPAVVPSNADLRVVPFGKIVRQHGVTRAGVSTFKLQLSQVGATLFEHLRQVQLSKKPLNEESPDYFNAAAYRTLELVDDCSPLGARWQETPSVLLRVSESEGDLKGLEVALLRSQFPELQEGLYLCDFIRTEVTNPDETVRGRIVRFYDVGAANAPATNIEVKTKTGSFEFPASLIKRDVVQKNGAWVIEDLELWADLKQFQGEREE